MNKQPIITRPNCGSYKRSDLLPPIPLQRLFEKVHSLLHSPPNPPTLGDYDPKSPPMLGDLGFDVSAQPNVGKCNGSATFQTVSQNRKIPKQHLISILFPTLSLSLLLSATAEPGQAQIPSSDLDLNAPPQVMELLQTPLKKPQVSNETPSQKSLTVPGLWWTDRLFGEKMVVHWFTYRRIKEGNSQVRLIVRPDLWSRYTYLERYAFLKRFGATTSAAGYHLLVMDRQNYPLGAYTCQFPPQTKPLTLYPWVNDPTSKKFATLPKIQAPCNAWISPVYGSQFF